MEKYFIKNTKDGIFLNIQVWKKEWSELMLTNITTLVNSKNFIFNGERSEHWIKKVIINDLSLNGKLDVGR